MKPILRISGEEYQDRKRPPKYYALVYKDYMGEYLVFAIPPLNLILRTALQIRGWLCGYKPTWLDNRIAEIRRDAYDAGFRAGKTVGREEARELLAKDVDAFFRGGL